MSSAAKKSRKPARFRTGQFNQPIPSCTAAAAQSAEAPTEGRAVCVPEVKAKEPPTQRADLFALGMILYELILETAVASDLGTATCRRLASGGLAAGHRRALCQNRLALSAIPSARTVRLVGRTRILAGTALPRGGVDKIPEGNPYRGLLPFEAEHRSLFSDDAVKSARWWNGSAPMLAYWLPPSQA